MSVLIKGIGMPETCDDCQFHRYHSRGEYVCVATPMFYPMNLANSKGIRKDWCPLVELPKHHGRLIDADRLMRVYEDRLEKVADRYGVDSSEAGILSGAMKLLMIELGIVEA